MQKGFEQGENENTEVFSQAALDEIGAEFNLGTLTFVSTPDSGIMTDNAIVSDEHGNKYFIKQYNEPDLETHASAYAAAETVAAENVVSVSMPLVPESKTYTVEIAGKTVSVFPAITHTPTSVETLEDKVHVMQQIGQELGNIHSVPVENTAGRVEPVFRWGQAAAERRTETIRQILEQIPRGDEASDFDRVALETIALKQSLLDRFSYPSGEMPLAICHGDFHKNNILFDEDMNTIAVCDWDNAGLSHPYVDFLNTYLTEVVSDRIDRPDDCREIGEAFAKAYTQATGAAFDEGELERAFHIIMQERTCSTFPLYQHYMQGDTRNDDRVPRTLERTKKYAEMYEELQELVRKTCLA